MSGSQINLSPALPYIEAKDLPVLVDEYLRDARLRVEEKTATNYDYLLSLLLEWWAEAAEALEYRLDERGWQRYECWLREHRPSSQSGEALTLWTRKKALSLCRRMLAWAALYGYLDRDFSVYVPSARGSAEKRTAPDVEQLRLLMEAAGKSGKPVRDQAIVALFVGTGVRRAEAAALNVQDLQFHADGSGRVHVRKGKNGKSRTVVFDATCGSYLRDLLLDLGRNRGPLFVGWRDVRLAPEGVYNAVKKAMRRAGIDSRGAGPHDLRRAFATAWTRMRRGLGDGQLLSMQLGHTTEEMSVLYSRPILDDLQERFVSPLSLL